MHPNTHVNKAQSTNDTIPSATHLAVASELDRIIEGVEVPGDVFAAKAEAFRHVVKLGRTCWQDALPHTLGEEFGGYAALMRRLAGKLRAVLPGCFEICMGRHGARSRSRLHGRPLPPPFRHLWRRGPPDGVSLDGLENADFFVTVSGLVKEVATLLSKITRDLRLMSSGPRSGFMEVRLPP